MVLFWQIKKDSGTNTLYTSCTTMIYLCKYEPVVVLKLKFCTGKKIIQEFNDFFNLKFISWKFHKRFNYSHPSACVCACVCARVLNVFDLFLLFVITLFVSHVRIH